MEFFDPLQFLRFVSALLFVMALMAGLAYVLRKFNDRQGLSETKKKRLKIVEIQAIDARRKLVLFRRDNVEHLVILGVNSETLIESGIESAQNNQD